MCAGMIFYTYIYASIKVNLLIIILVCFNISTFITHLVNFNFSTLPKTIILMTIVAFCLYQFISSYHKKKLFIYLILIAGLLFALVYIIHYRQNLFDFKHIFENRLGVFFDNENEISKELGFFAVISFGMIIKHKKVYEKILFSLLFALFLFLVLSTGSISNLFTTVIVSLLCLILCQKTPKHQILALIIVLCLVAAIVGILQLSAFKYFKDRIDGIFNTLFNKADSRYDGSANNRLQGAITAIKIGLNKPIFGFGYKSATRFTVTNIQAHNNFAELFIDFGIVGLLLYESLLFLPLWKGFDRNKMPYVLSIILYMFLFQLFLTTYYKKFEYIFLACIYSILSNEFNFNYVVCNSSKNKKTDGKVRILEIIPSFVPLGGAESFVTSFAIALKEKFNNGIDLKVVCLYKQTPTHLLDKLKENGIEVLELNKTKGLDLKCASALRDLIFEYNPDIIHTHLYSLSTLKIALPFKRKSLRIYHTIHHNYSKNKKGQNLLKYLTKHSYLTPICVAKKPSEEYTKFLGRRVEYINNGIDLSSFKSNKNLKSRKRDFICVGRFVPVKNQSFLINLFSYFDCLKNYNLTFLGDGPLLEECKDLCNKLNLDNIEFCGNVSNVHDYMADSKVLLIPSCNEGNPMVINEAFASGMGVIGNDVGGIHDLLSNVKYGGLCRISNPKSFFEKTYKTINELKQMDSILKYDFEGIDINNTVRNYLQFFNINVKDL